MRFPTKKCALLSSAAMLLALPAMAQETTQLDEIILITSKRDVATDTATPTTTVDQGEIDDRQATTVAELVDSVPGVTLVNGATPRGSGINIRGFGANGTYGTDQKVLVQVDGASMGAEELYRISSQLFTDPALYREVSVIRGMVGSFEFGTGAFGGVVKAETKNASDFTGGEPGLKLRQTLQFGTNGDATATSTILAWQPTEQFEFLANYTTNQGDFYTDGDGTVVENTDFDMPSWLLKGSFHFGDAMEHSLTLSFSDTSTDDKDVPYDEFGLGGGSFGNVDRAVRSRTAILRYDFDPENNDLIDAEVVLSYADQQIDQEYVPGSSAFEGFFPTVEDMCADSFFGIICTDHRYETTKLTAKNTAHFDTGAVGHSLITGVELSRRERLDAPAAPGGTDDRLSVFAINEMSLGNWTVAPALRFETQDISNDDDTVSYSNDALVGGLSLRYAFDSGFAIFASAAYTENMPIIDDMGSPTFMTQSEKGRSYEVGFSYDNTGVFGAGDELSFKTTAYRTDIWDITSYSGIAAAELSGVEIEAAYSMAAGFYVDLNTNWQSGDIVDPVGGGFWGGIPADELRVTFGRKWGEELDLSWEVVANAAMTRSTTPSVGYTVHNLRATYTPESGILEGAELRLGIENLTDKAYTPHLATRAAPGRTVKFSIAKTF